MLSVDQSTQGTKALLFDQSGKIIRRFDLQHRQIVDENGWVEHDLEEIWENTKAVVKGVIEEAGILPEQIAGMGISNQRETVAAWDRETGRPVFHGIVWQCPRGEQICGEIRARGYAGMIKDRTGLELSPYFSASKMAWILQNVPKARSLAEKGRLCLGTMDAWLVFCMTEGSSFKTDCSNASRTQLFNIHSLTWDTELCDVFGIPAACLPEVCDSDAVFGETTMKGLFAHPVPISCVMGDSHGALFGQGCHQPGMAKATYGTGSSVMMNVGDSPVFSNRGLAASLAWSRGGKVQYVLEGNINYTGAVITWLQKQMGLIEHASETEELAFRANPRDKTYLVPAFTGLGAPYYDSAAAALITGMTRMTGKAELAKAALDCIAYQIRDILVLMNQEFSEKKGSSMAVLKADGGPARNRYLMQFQADILGIPVDVPEAEELSGIGAAYMAGISLGFYNMEDLFADSSGERYTPAMDQKVRQEKTWGWRKAVERTLSVGFTHEQAPETVSSSLSGLQ